MLRSLRSQSEHLKAAQRKVFDVLSLLGVSQSLLRGADRRVRTDKLLVGGAMLLTLGLFLLIVYYRH